MSSQLTGLVVEDEWLLRLELAEELAAAGWQVREAGTGEEALQCSIRLKAEGEPIDFLVTDIRLGGPVDGWDVAEACRKRLARPAGDLCLRQSHCGKPHGSQDSVFLSKPVDSREPDHACRRLTGGPRLRCELAAPVRLLAAPPLAAGAEADTFRECPACPADGRRCRRENS